jgi:excisionase family DNA binding protein
MTVVDLARVRVSLARLDELASGHPELVAGGPTGRGEWERTLELAGLDADKESEMAEPPTYGLEEVAAIVGVHVETIRRAIRDGELKAAKLPRNYRVSRIELARWWSALGGGELFPADVREERRAAPEGPQEDEP